MVMVLRVEEILDGAGVEYRLMELTDRAVSVEDVVRLSKGEINPGWRLLEVEFEDDDGQWIYELEVLKEDGEVIELQYDAETGQYLGIED